MVVYIENSRDLLKKPKNLVLMNGSAKAQDKINTEKSTSFLYTNNEQVKTDNKNIIPFIIPSKKF